MKKIIKIDKIEAERVVLRQLKTSDVTQRYVDWLNDPEVNQYLSVRGQIHNIKTVRDYVRSFEGSNNKILFGIFDKSTKLHIGNITFSNIDWKNETGTLGVTIGDKSYWGKGYAAEALLLIIKFAFSKLKLHRLEAWVTVENIASQKLFKKVGFNMEGTLKDRVKLDQGYDDGLIFGLVNKQ